MCQVQKIYIQVYIKIQSKYEEIKIQYRNINNNNNKEKSEGGGRKMHFFIMFPITKYEKFKFEGSCCRAQ